MSTLSACLIAKNEQHTIGNCLKSLQSIANEIIVVDTGSTDDTIHIATSYGAKVIHTIWEDDFSKARNLSLTQATQDWILIIDCDEVIPQNQVAFFKAFLDLDTSFQAFQFKVHNLIKGQINSSAIVLRLFRNNPLFQFSGKMHEQISPSILTAYGQNAIGLLDCYLDHYGYDDDFASQQQKSDRNLSLLLHYKEEEKDGYYYFVLGNEYSRLHQLEEAAKCYALSLQHTDYEKHQDIYYPYLLINLASIYYAFGDYDKSLKLCHQGEIQLPHFQDLYMTTALCYYSMGKLHLAKDYLQRYIDCKDSPLFYPSHQYDAIDAPHFLALFDAFVIPPFLYSVLFVEELTPTLFEMVKNLNNISFKVFAVVKEERAPLLLESLNHLTKLGVQILTLTASDDYLDSILSEVSGTWLLTLNGDEFIPLSALYLLQELTLLADCTQYNLTISDWLTGASSSEVRLIKISSNTLFFTPSYLTQESCIVAFKNYSL
ncbi:MAG: glycosyltransferase [Cellulosilyticaceae bacterium]